MDALQAVRAHEAGDALVTHVDGQASRSSAWMRGTPRVPRQRVWTWRICSPSSASTGRGRMVAAGSGAVARAPHRARGRAGRPSCRSCGPARRLQPCTPAARSIAAWHRIPISRARPHVGVRQTASTPAHRRGPLSIVSLPRALARDCQQPRYMSPRAGPLYPTSTTPTWNCREGFLTRVRGWIMDGLRLPRAGDPCPASSVAVWARSRWAALARRRSSVSFHCF